MIRNLSMSLLIIVMASCTSEEKNSTIATETPKSPLTADDLSNTVAVDASAKENENLCPQFANGCPMEAARLTANKGLFVQVSTLSATAAADLKEWFEHICEKHNRLSKSSTNYIHNLVLQDVADEQGRLYMKYRAELPGTVEDYHPSNHQIDVLAPYFHCFDKIFFGTLDPVYHGRGSLYVEGISSEQFRWDYINKSTLVMDKLAAIFSGLNFNWYLTFESNLNYLYLKSVKEGYKALFKELTERMAARKSGHTLWSPNFWSLYRKLPASEKSQLGEQMMEVFKTAPHIDMLHFQDFLGGTSANADNERANISDAIGYYNLIASLPTRPAQVAVNLEQYKISSSSGALEPVAPLEMANREEQYLRAQVPIGISWEIRFWRYAHLD